MSERSHQEALQRQFAARLHRQEWNLVRYARHRLGGEHTQERYQQRREALDRQIAEYNARASELGWGSFVSRAPSEG